MNWLNRVRTRWEIVLWRWGWAGVMALLVAGGAAIIELLVVAPAQRALVREHHELAQLNLAATQAQSAMKDVPQTDQQRLTRVRAVLEQTPQVDAVVRRMNELAQAEQINLAQSDYHADFNSPLQARRIQITQPVRASYPQLRRYVEAVLRAVPGASLDQITARRENVAQGQVEARLKWSIWATAASFGAAAPAQSRP